MVSLRVIRLKDIIRLIIVLAIIVVVFQFISTKPKLDTKGYDTISKIPKETLIRYLNYSLPNYLANNDDNVQQIDLNFSANQILKFELEMLNNVIEKTDLEINEQELTIDDIDELVANQEENQIEVIENNVKESFNIEDNGVRINNGSVIELTSDIVLPDFELKNTKDIIIYHTHTCESYTPTEENQYEASGNFRTLDLNNNVARVGDELENYLKNFGFNVIHDKTLHDYPAYSGSYDNSYKTVSNILEKNPDIEIIFDIHRDAIGDSSYAPTVKINGEYCSQLMFVIGTNGGGLEHNNWQNNLKTAIKIEQKSNEMYPGLFKPIIVRNSRYNQNLGNGASIIEVGATGNTLEQSLNSMKYLSLVLNALWGNK